MPSWRACILTCLLMLGGMAGTAAQIITQTDKAVEQARAADDALRASVGSPARIDILDQATLRLADKLRFVPRDIAASYLEAFDRPVPPDLFGVVIYDGRTNWLAVLRFIKDGFVDAAEIRNWSSDDLLASLKAQVDAENVERTGRGQPALEVAGWLVPPHYDPATASIAWAASIPPVTATRERDSEAVHRIAMFGRDGYLMVEILASAGEIRDNRADEQLFLSDITFLDGKRYADFRRGTDRMAPGGLQGVFGVREFRRAGLLDGLLEGDRLMILIVGGSLTAGAGALGLARFLVYRRRYQR